MTDVYQARSPAVSNVEIGNVWYVVRRHLLSILALAALAISGTYFYLSQVEQVYRAQATMVLVPSQPNAGQGDPTLQTLEFSRSFVATELDVIRSRAFSAALAEELDLFSREGFLDADLDAKLLSDDARRSAVIDKTRISYSVFRQGESLALDLVGSSSDPELAAAIANGVVHVYTEQGRKERRSSLSSSIEMLERNIATQGEKLSEREIELTNLIRGDDLDDPGIASRLRSEIDRLEALISVGGGTSLSQASLLEQQERLSTAKAELERRTRQQFVLKRTEREIQLERLRYEAMIARLNDLQARLENVGSQTRQVTEAQVPTHAAWPNLKFALAAAGVGAVAVGFLVALLREGLDRRLHTDAQVFQAAGLQNLGFLPRIMKWRVIRRFNPAEYIMKHEQSHFTESVRSILAPITVHRGKRVIMVASGLPNEGKTCISVAMATTSAIDGARTLLIDLDANRHCATGLLGCSPVKTSLLELIKDDSAPQKAVIGNMTLENLDVLSVANRSQGAQSEINRLLREFLFTVSERYDFVVIDTPPVLLTSDACRYAELAEEALLVARWNSTRAVTLSDSRSKLESAGVSVFASVLNDVDFSRHRRYGYGGYISSYAQGYSYANPS